MNEHAVVSTGRIVVLVLPEVNLLDLGGPVQVFDAAAHLGAGYRLEYVADAPETVSAQGLRLAGLGPLGGAVVGPGDLVLVPGPRLRRPEPGGVRRKEGSWCRKRPCGGCVRRTTRGPGWRRCAAGPRRSARQGC
ncbi:hypothetical protein ACFVYE_35435 [Streptomyces sp. NPDC058239]|uniref:hypothetical protein n=1 Tax=Streptomyces sp. NPDC058239 TaxID=3346395 RepID=UPI0036F1939D